jgi:hypothetical protein
LLSLIEGALATLVPVGNVLRSANYRKGIARMRFDDGRGSIVLQNFSLADGQLCLRVELHRVGANVPGETAIYPQGARFDWEAEAARIAREWSALALKAPDTSNAGETLSA